MSERTTIGGTVYEAIGSSSSNLLLKCNGTARIQWGNKLIDLIKNGKIASGDSKELIFTISDESEIKSDGIYVLTTEESNQLWVCKDGNKYNFTEENLCILANEPQNLTVEQKTQALTNIGMYYNTLEDVQKANIQNGVVYVLENNTLYTIKNGKIEEFQATLKSVTVEEETDGVKLINSSVKIILSILDEEYLVLADQRITANYSIHVKNSAQIGSESADKTHGYRLYIDGDTSYLDVDEINVRNGIKFKLYKEITFDSFIALIDSETLEPNAWYLITDFQNHWKLVKDNFKFNRPILVKALTNKDLYEYGFLFNDRRVKIKYDPSFQETIIQKKETDGQETEVAISTRGKITWMQDYNNNEANFDFLDYTDSEGKDLATLHIINDNLDKSIFPKDSYNNKLTVYNLKGTILKEKLIDDTNASIIDFKFDDSEDKRMLMHDNDIECYGLILNTTCTKFYNNVLKKSIKLEINNTFVNNEFNEIYFEQNFQDITNFQDIDITKFNSVEFSYNTQNNKCNSFKHCIFNNELTDNIFNNIENSVFNKIISKSKIGYVVKPENTYQYQFYTITDSSIGEIYEGATFQKDIINSNINKIYGNVQVLSRINNSKIEQILNEAKIIGDITDCTINEISNATIQGNLYNNTISTISTESNIQSSINNSNIGEIINKSSIENDIINSTIQTINNSVLKGKLINTIINSITNSSINSQVTDCTFEHILEKSTLDASFSDSIFKILHNCTFESGTINNVESFYDLSDSFNSSKHVLLYNSSKRKEIYITDRGIKIICIPDVIFYRGMIIMHSGIEPIPKGWAPCDGGTYEWEGVTSKTPDLKKKFIRAVTSAGEIGFTENKDINEKDELMLKKEQLPKHKHEIDISKLPQYTTTEIEGYTARYDPRQQFVTTTSGTLSVHVSVSVSVDGSSDSDSDSSSISLNGMTLNYQGIRANYETVAHSHKINWGKTNILTEDNDVTIQQQPIKPIPNYYSLIFIMKL